VDAQAYEFPPEVADMALPGPHPLPLVEQLATIWFGVIDLLGAIWTGLALRSAGDRR
jgi:hypothetical protein